MSRRQSLIIAGVLGVVIVAALVGLWRTPISSPQAVLQTPIPVEAEHRKSAIVSTPSGPPKAADQKYGEQVQQAVKGLNQPLRFWGKVVDQNGSPISDVEISYKARSAHAPIFSALGSKESYGKTKTNADGLFHIDAGKGDMLGLFGFTKPGYRLAQNTKTGFAYAGSPELHRPNATQPVVFVMYQEDAIEPLSHFSARFDLPCDGAPLTIDLATGKPSEAGQFRVLLKRNPLHIQRGRQFQWSAKIEIIGGGLQKAIAEGAVVAPTEGYGPTMEYDFRPKNPDWDPEWDRGLRETFYFVTADAKYGRIQLRLHADSEPPPASLFVESWINPSGSRNLEPSDAR